MTVGIVATIIFLFVMLVLFSAIGSVADALVKRALAGIPKPYDVVFLIMALIAIISLAALVWFVTP